jgi:hypothetical protein
MQADTSIIKMSKIDNTSEFKEKLKKFIDIDFINLSSEFKKHLEADNKEEYLKVLKQLKMTVIAFYFNSLVFKIDEWEKDIQMSKSLTDLDINYSDIWDILTAMRDQVSKSIDVNSSAGSNNTKDSYLKSLAKKGNLDAAGNSMQLINNKVIVSPIPGKRTLQQGTNNKIPITFPKQDEDAIFSDLKAIKFDGLFKRDLTIEEITQESERLAKDNLNDATQVLGKNNLATKINKSTSNFNTVDCNYPFKQDKISCIIF